MDPIKEAFLKIKEEINLLKKEITSIKTLIKSINLSINTPTPQHSNNFNESPSTNTPTDKIALEGLYTPNNLISTGNRGVPTDKQTDKQTNQQTNRQRGNTSINPEKPLNEGLKNIREVLNSLSDIKKEVRYKIKSLTPQEMLIFSKIYSLEEEGFSQITYKFLSEIFKLSESSIRDYTNRLIKKGIPVVKIKQNNKIIYLRISEDLKNIATLATLQQLRDL